LCLDNPRLYKPGFRAAVKSGLASIGYSIRRHALLEKHTSVLVGVSGGIDSLVLLSLLHAYNKTFQQSWHITAIHVDPMFPAWNSAALKTSLSTAGMQFVAVRTNIYKHTKTVQDKCFSCSRERRARILQKAEAMNIFTVALGHHQEDVVETLLLNMLYTGRSCTLLPRQPVLHGRCTFVRPLYYLSKKEIRDMASAFGLKAYGNVCPYVKNSRRETIRGLLRKLKKQNPDVYTNIFRSIFNIKKTYMPSC
jgi:tRNA 2-thiocytidine biosynthesis protein TtcA